MLAHIQELYRFRDLLWLWVLRNIRVRYKQSVLGVLWAILQPLSLMIIFSVVFSLFVKVPTDGVPYPIFSYSALLPWTFFATAISFGITSLTNNINLITKIYFPREILPISVVIAGLFDFLIGILVFGVLIVYYQRPIGFSLLLYPVLVCIEIIFIMGVVFFSSALNVLYRDIQFVVPLAVQLLLYATPVLYPASLVPERFRWLYLLNPMAALITAYRDITLTNTWPNGLLLLQTFLISILIFFGGYIFFKKVEWQFADII